MEKDSLNIPLDGSGTIEYLSTVHYYKKGNIIVHSVGKNENIISTLSTILGNQFAGDLR
ncbi:hypothetical protein [Clostridium beijerinckii]|uniref:hypothetical protein n=1 Tax=Clostridium beijerinckii TaxID=1520 RepID=UPI00156DB17C|nr:hypothetical protein [Clostridium beijerinckii]NRT78422.1 hypothetical protein [Clostridium beijerinckii]